MQRHFDHSSGHLTRISTIALLALTLGGAAGAQPMDHAAHMQHAQRQQEVAKRGSDVMPFSLNATTHIFTKSTDGGVQQVVAKRASDAAQIKLVRQHLHEIQGQFNKGDFSGPTHIHGQAMPGLAELQAANPGQIAIAYRDIPRGGQLTYTTREPRLVTALHSWFDAQVSDHGKDAAAGPGHHHHQGHAK